MILSNDNIKFIRGENVRKKTATSDVSNNIEHTVKHKKSAVRKKVVETSPATASTKSMPATLMPVFKRHLLHTEVVPEKYFILCDGRKIKSVKELADVLQLISEDIYKYHVTDSKNDFSNWINDVFGEPELAKKVRTVHNRLETSIELYRYMFRKIEESVK
jgi:hypothetical protein